MLKKVENVAYKVQLPDILSDIHLVFHMSLFEPFYQDSYDSSISVSTRAPTSIRDEYNKMAKEIVADRNVQHKNRPPSKEYLIWWCGLLETQINWEPAEKLWQFENLIREYEAS